MLFILKFILLLFEELFPPKKFKSIWLKPEFVWFWYVFWFPKLFNPIFKFILLLFDVVGWTDGVPKSFNKLSKLTCLFGWLLLLFVLKVKFEVVFVVWLLFELPLKLKSKFKLLLLLTFGVDKVLVLFKDVFVKLLFEKLFVFW